MKTLTMIAVAALALQPAIAAAQSGDTITTFTIEDLEKALDEIGATYVDANDDRTINITFESTLMANGAVMACDEDETQKNCYGTSILAVFDAAEGTTPQDIAAAITNYNYNQNFGRAYLDPEGNISVRMYIISEGGISRENYSMQIGLWSISLERFADYLYEGADGSKRKTAR